MGAEWIAYPSAALPLHLNTWHAVVSLGEIVERARYGSNWAPLYIGTAFCASAPDNVIGAGYCRADGIAI